MENNAIPISDSKAHTSVGSTLIESMTKLVHKVAPWQHYTIRCWRQEENYTPESSDESAAAASAALKKITPTQDKYAIAEAILSVDRMNAVEVINESGEGVVVYKDWP